MIGRANVIHKQDCIQITRQIYTQVVQGNAKERQGRLEVSLGHAGGRRILQAAQNGTPIVCHGLFRQHPSIIRSPVMLCSFAGCSVDGFRSAGGAMTTTGQL
jgi:hypothetical protein